MSNHASCRRHGDTLEVVIRDSSFNKIFEAEASVSRKSELENLLLDLKNKGVDLIKIIKNKMISDSDSDWF